MTLKLEQFPVYHKNHGNTTLVKEDWLLKSQNFIAKIYHDEDNDSLILTNGLISRIFSTKPNGSTIDYKNERTGESLLRGIKPEAKITLNGKEYDVGGLIGQIEYGYLLNSTIKDFKSDPNSFQLVSVSSNDIQKRFDWKRIRHHDESRSWPPKGKELIMGYQAPNNASSEIQGFLIKIHYECYDGIPLLSKWISCENHTNNQITLEHYVNDILALIEAPSNSEGRFNYREKQDYAFIYFESDYSFSGMDAFDANHTTHWKKDPQYSSQVPFLSDAKLLMESYIEMGPAITLKPIFNDADQKPQGEGRQENNDYNPDSGRFEGYRDFQLMESNFDRQRQGLAKCQMYRTIAPWITENPLMMHLVSFNPKDIKNAINQMKEVGFEMLIFSFWSGFNANVLELGVDHPDWIEEMIDEIKEEIIDEIHDNGLDVGGYSLLASRKISEEDDVVNPYTGKSSHVEIPELEEGIEAIQGVDESITNIKGGPTFGNSPCLGSVWGQKYFKSLYKTIELLNLTILEHDGSYPGDLCASTKHPGHKGLNDSQWTQWKIITDFYKWCRGRGVYLNVPDWYMLTGSNKTGIGYKEVNWSLPRDRQVMLGRQNIYDGTWDKTPSMGWTHVPLTQYHSVPEYSPEVATLEPLSEHLKHYEMHLVQNLGCGVQGCYRGYRLYDTQETKELVKKYVGWYKKYRNILDSDIVHIRRPDGRNIDGMIHVNPNLKIKGLALFFNPTNEEKRDIIKIPLYYTGLCDKVFVSERESNAIEYSINRDYSIELELEIPAKYYTWYVIKATKT